MHPQPPTTPETFGQYLYRKRLALAAERRAKVTQKDMAATCGCSPITYYCWERDRYAPTPDKQREIRAKLGE